MRETSSSPHSFLLSTLYFCRMAAKIGATRFELVTSCSQGSSDRQVNSQVTLKETTVNPTGIRVYNVSHLVARESIVNFCCIEVGRIRSITVRFTV